MRSQSHAVDNGRWLTPAKKSLLLAGGAIALVELVRRLRERLRPPRALGQFVSDEWLAQHVSSRGDGEMG